MNCTCVTVELTLVSFISFISVLFSLRSSDRSKRYEVKEKTSKHQIKDETIENQDSQIVLEGDRISYRREIIPNKPMKQPLVLFHWRLLAEFGFVGVFVHFISVPFITFSY